MFKEKTYSLNNNMIWACIGIVFLCVIGILVVVYSHEVKKPDSPHSLVASAFNQMFTAKEWKPGMGKKPLIYHPAAFNRPVWRPLPPRQGSIMHQKPGTVIYNPNLK